MKKFTFIILNYQSLQETIGCIESIQKLEYEEKYVIVVDNASDNQKEFFETLKRAFRSEDNIVYLRSEKNLGYARGNNIGIDYAKRVLKADFVCVINPDVLVRQADFIDKCIKLYEKYNYAVMGPGIISHGKDSNPLGGYRESVGYWIYAYFEDYRIYFIKKLNLNKFNIFKRKRTDIQVNVGIEKHINIKDQVETYILDRKMKVMLSGACLIFSPKFLDGFRGFCEKTFLYGEENILACVCFHLGYDLLYTSEVVTMHEGSKSLINIEKSEKGRWMYRLKAGTHSCLAIAKVCLHKHNKKYLRNCLNPAVDNYYEV